MDHLTVLYDVRCGLCRRARAWLELQPAYVRLEFVAAGSQQARRRFPGLEPSSTLRDLTVVDASGGYYQGARAWLMCLWALRNYRSTAFRLSSPALLPLARRTITWISTHRRQISTLAGLGAVGADSLSGSPEPKPKVRRAVRQRAQLLRRRSLKRPCRTCHI